MAASEAASTPVTKPEDEKKVADFLNQHAQDASVAKAMRKMIEEKATSEAFVKKFASPHAPESSYGRYLLASYEAVIS